MVDRIKAKNIPGKRSPILCREGKINVKTNKSEIIRDGWRPYLKCRILRSNQMKKGNNDIKEYLSESLQIEKVKNLGAKEKQSVANQRLL